VAVAQRAWGPPRLPGHYPSRLAVPRSSKTCLRPRLRFLARAAACPGRDGGNLAAPASRLRESGRLSRRLSSTAEPPGKTTLIAASSLQRRARQPPQAVFSYNHSGSYVTDVLDQLPLLRRGRPGVPPPGTPYTQDTRPAARRHRREDPRLRRGSQLGKPYFFGAAVPDAFDLLGLAMMA